MTGDARAGHLHSIQECRIQLGKAEQAARVAREELANEQMSTYERSI